MARLIAQCLADEGHALVRQLLPEEEILQITAWISSPGAGAGTRTLLHLPWCAALAERIRADARLRPAMPPEARMVQCTLFEKSLARNWLVGLHQDLAIPVAEQVNSPRCGAWSRKEGALFVQPPAALLEELLAVRVHLDNCDGRNGALRVVPGSHRLGRLGATEARRLREERGEQMLPACRGDALLMRPLLLHSSSRMVRDSPRRVLHFLIGPSRLPEGLRWPERAGTG
jgi:hypothetical protein